MLRSLAKNLGSLELRPAFIRSISSQRKFLNSEFSISKLNFFNLIIKSDEYNRRFEKGKQNPR